MYEAALEDVFSGRGHLVMLAGESGIGKTRTAEELSEYAKILGADVLWGRCPCVASRPHNWRSTGPWCHC